MITQKSAAGETDNRDGAPTPRMIDLFAGAGGMTEGFAHAGEHRYTPVWAADFNRWAADTYNANFGPHCTLGDIVEILRDPDFETPQADVVVGGPPCQGFSLLNRRRDGDPRKALWRPFIEVVIRSGARVFVMENVPQFLGSREHRDVLDTAAALGFQTASAVLCAADYGVPQTRHRAFVVGSCDRNPAEVFPPPRTHIAPAAVGRRRFEGLGDPYIPYPDPWRTVRDAIADLPPPEGSAFRPVPPPLDLHFGRTPTARSTARYEAIPQEGMNRFDLHRLAPDLTPDCWVRKTSGGTDLFGRLWWDRPAFTIRTEFFKPEKGRYLHPSQHRPLTHREAARLQSFPDSFVFSGTKTEIARQIGNAVPPLLAAHIADAVYSLVVPSGQT